MASSCWQVIFRPDSPVNQEFEQFLEDFFEVVTQDFSDDGHDLYTGYASAFEAARLHAAAAEAKVKLPPFAAEKLESANWLKDYVIRFEPFEESDFLIYGIHETAAPKTDKIPLQIYAATAFGSNHQTTRMCLRALCRLCHEGIKPVKIWDVGCGSGILSLAALSLWPAARVTASDIDDEAVIVTNGNAAANRLAERIETVQSDGATAPLIANNAPYDLILANILARPLIAMAADLNKLLAPNGYVVLSGFVDNQQEWISSEFQQHGLTPIQTFELDNWRAILLKKA